MSSTPNQRAQEELPQLLDWIESRPELSAIRKAANSAICNYQTDKEDPNERIILYSSDIKIPAKNSLDKFVEVVWVPGRNMRGKAYASQSSDVSLNSVAKLMSLSTIWDFFTTIPVLSYPLQLSAGFLSLPIGAGLSFFLLWASNIAGENATNRSPGHATKASVSLIAFLLLSAAKTAVSGVGTDLVIGIRGIQQNYASQLISESLIVDRKNLEEKKNMLFSDPLLLEQTRKCDEKTRALSRLPRNDPGWQAAYLAEGGQYQDRIATIDQVKRRYGSPANMPSCLAVRVLSEDKNTALQKPTQDLQERQNSSKTLPALTFLKENYPERYSEAFIERPSGDLVFRDGTLAVGEATSLFFTNLSQPNKIASLGFSLFTFVVSITLTGSATIMLFLVSRNREVMASFSSNLDAIKVAYLGRYIKLLDQKSKLAKRK
jgi:hypothetical protein